MVYIYDMIQIMKKLLNTKNIVLLAISIFLSLATHTSLSLYNVDPCFPIAGCESAGKLVGDLTFYKQGYPLPYKEYNTFVRTSGESYGEGSMGDGEIYCANIVLDILFWFALLTLLLNGYNKYKNKIPLKFYSRTVNK